VHGLAPPQELAAPEVYFAFAEASLHAPNPDRRRNQGASKLAAASATVLPGKTPAAHDVGEGVMRQRRSWFAGALPVLLAALPVMADTPVTTNVRLRGPEQSRSVRQALLRAAQRISRPECARILSDFRDAEGRPLQANLDALGFDVSDYMLNRIFFYDGDERRGACRFPATLAATAPGSRVIHVCSRFVEYRRKHPEWTEAVLIHEALHTLGLGENPPSSAHITNRVLKHCR